MFESCLRNYKERLGVLFFVAMARLFTCSRSQFFASEASPRGRARVLPPQQRSPIFVGLLLYLSAAQKLHDTSHLVRNSDLLRTLGKTLLTVLTATSPFLYIGQCFP